MQRQHFQGRLAFYQNALAAFTSSSSSTPFSVLHSVSTRSFPSDQNGGGSCSIAAPLYILDASFNPPTIAHMRMILLTGLLTIDPLIQPQRRLLILLATLNADKALQPASFKHRLSMMEMFTADILSEVSDHGIDLSIDLGVTSKPYFVDKVNAIQNSGLYPDIEHSYIIGFDTLIRILDAQYYPPSYSLERLGPFLKKHRLLVCYRLGDKWGDRSEQDKFLINLSNGSLDAQCGRRDWVRDGRIKMFDVSSDGKEVVSSTKVRNAINRGADTTLEKLVPPKVCEWIQYHQLYK